ncbi:N-acetylglucosamine kinase [Marinihelvus fidelis]|uniref:N-acetylglucosamine kinase n=1 Tax=Marinihelvus fidelis TaxID=2613842 RepID=UPI00177FF22F|nr:BadF/BadG/BcrA/BcrD ATPase family protein [Marinihelvus fidelis]
MNTTKHLLGIDGGGSRTRAVLAEMTPDGQVTVLGRGDAGSGNPLLAGHRQVLANLDSATAQAFSALPDPSIIVDAAVLALAGAGAAEESALIEQWVTANPRLSAYRLIPDWQPVLVAGTPDGHGIGLIAGTGSVAFGATADGRTVKRGGWGHWFGDQGSGYDLGRQALTAAAHAADGLAAATRLGAAIATHFDGATPDAISTLLARHDNPRRAIAALAPVVLDAAADGDDVAVNITENGARHLAGLVASVANALALDDGYPLALAGSVVCENAAYRQRVLDTLGQSGPVPGTVTRVEEPVMGCITLARHELLNTNTAWRDHA